MNMVASLTPPAPPPQPTGLAILLKMAFDGYNMAALRGSVLARSPSGPLDAASLIDLCVIEQVLGDPASGLNRQSSALALNRLYRSPWPASARALKVLAFMAPGDISSNTPIDFLLQGSNSILYSLYMVPGQPLPDPLPDHDIAIVIVGESDRVRPILAQIEDLIPTWPCPVINRPSGILLLSREAMFPAVSAIPGVLIPPTIRIGRDDFEKLGRSLLPPCHFIDHAGFPLIARLIGSHAGRGLVKLDQPRDIGDYLTVHPDPEFFLSPFVDYRSPDGLFRKYRIIWVDGRPYPVHMALANEWKVWYLNAGMADSAAKRAEEERFMSDFEAGFALRHAQALSAMVERFGLEYMGIDCAETADGKLLVFEGDIALVAHDMDPPDLYPYKGPHMRNLFDAFFDMLKRHAKERKPIG
jgi:hypothetical protein